MGIYDIISEMGHEQVVFTHDKAKIAPATIKLSVFVVNHGEAMVSRGVLVQVFSKDKSKLLGSSVVDADLPPGGGALVRVALTEATGDNKNFIVEIDRDEEGKMRRHECAADNNSLAFELKALRR